jgi:hypothetical protein
VCERRRWGAGKGECVCVCVDYVREGVHERESVRRLYERESERCVYIRGSVYV